MDIGLILKAAGVGMLVTVTCQILTRLGRDEHATYVSIAGIIIVLMMLIMEIGNLIDTVRGIFNI